MNERLTNARLGLLDDRSEPDNRFLTSKFQRGFLLAYGLLNGLLYASLLPLWEGFDEEFHYGYVQYLGAHHRFPVFGQARLSAEIDQSATLVPISYIMIRNMHVNGVRDFAQYFALDSATRHRLHTAARNIAPESASSDGAFLGVNYEAQHAPLAYLLMMIPNQLLSRAPLPVRVLIVRWIATIVATLLMYFGALALGREAGLSDALAMLLAFLIFSCQMFWATVAHVANDWLAVPLALWLIVEAMRFDRAPSFRSATRLALFLGLGLLTKAYFLVFAPLYVAMVIVWSRRRMVSNRSMLALAAIPVLIGGPWYVRNLLLYGNISGRFEESSGVSVGKALGSLTSVPWIKSIPVMARNAFWTGNANFTDFSVHTMNAVVLLLGAAVVLFIWSTTRDHSPGYFRRAAFLGLPLLLFCSAMVYLTGSSYIYTKGEATVAGPWYVQAVMPLLLCIALLGCMRLPRPGSWIATLTAILWSYVLTATYLAKLFPLYGGYTGGRSTLREIVHWYTTAWPATADILDTTAMVPAFVLAVLLLFVMAALLVLLPTLVRAIWSKAEAC